MSNQFCNEYNIPSINSDEFKEILSSSSFDRSSIGSIPWAEDVIKQNQQEWERIERMFYGEEELPNNLKEIDLKNEILEWREAFPHLRISGIKLTKKSVDRSELIKFEKFLDDHSSSKYTTNQKVEKNLSKNKINNNSEDLYKTLENNLRISSVPMKSKKNISLITPITQNTKNERIRSEVVKNKTYSQNFNLKISSDIAKSFTFPNSENLNKTIIKPSNSATIFRIPPIASERNYFTHPPLKKSLTEPKSGRSMILKLPLITQKNRSISAAITNRIPSDFTQSYSAPKLKKLK